MRTKDIISIIVGGATLLTATTLLLLHNKKKIQNFKNKLINIILNKNNNNNNNNKINAIVFSGPSGVGKGTIINKLKKEFPNTFAVSVSHTTRLPRKGEVHGKDYYFINLTEMNELINNTNNINNNSDNQNIPHSSSRTEFLSDMNFRTLM
eukprot:Tbor_TRINITY_DN5773_c3_g1::TRINITY_DN5773_c3_g1_i2::g.20526::m.20526/K00942/E2.7.4.8, gmk; guanylate kinase